MPNDALNYYFVANELNSALSGGRIEKINMPTNGEIVFKCHSQKSTCFLLLSAEASAPRIHLTTSVKENPITAPSFLMHLRKHLGNGSILKIYSQDFERVIVIEILSKSEFSEKVNKVIVEITGTYSNIILVDENGIISEAIKHITPDLSRSRLVLPGVKYTPIPPQDKLVPSDERLVDMLASFDGDRPDKYLLSVMSGMAPSTISECVYRALGGIRKISCKAEAEAIMNAVKNIYNVKNPCLIKRDGKYIDFLPSPFVSLAGEIEYYPTLNMCMDIYYADRCEGESAKIKRLMSIVKNAIKRVKKKLEDFSLKKSECMDFEGDRIKGELITANIYKIKKGESAVKLYDYYTDSETEIPLDKNKSPAENAQYYFKRYTKKKNTLSALSTQIEESENLLEKYENALLSFELSTSKSDVEDIETELYILKLLQNREIKNRKRSASQYLSVNVDGFKIEIGKNNIQNERLYKSAGGKDIWLHVKDAHGSHVIVRCPDKDATEHVLLCASQLAAYYSKSREAGKVAVDYTYAKYVKPIPGAGPGRVIYTNQKTLFVSPKSVIDFA